MTLEDQVPDHDLCERLKELGMPQDTYFWYVCDDQEQWNLTPHAYGMDGIAAPTVAELGEMLPVTIWVEEKRWYLEQIWNEILITLFYTDPLEECAKPTKPPCNDSKEANARAKLLIWCAEQGLAPWQKAA